MKRAGENCKGETEVRRRDGPDACEVLHDHTFIAVLESCERPTPKPGAITMVQGGYRQDKNADRERPERRDECTQQGSGVTQVVVACRLPHFQHGRINLQNAPAITVDVYAEWWALPKDVLFGAHPRTQAVRSKRPQPGIASREKRMRDTRVTECTGPTAPATSSYAMAIPPDTPAAFVIHDIWRTRLT